MTKRYILSGLAGLALLMVIALSVYAGWYSYMRRMKIAHNDACARAMAALPAGTADNIPLPPCAYEIIPLSLFERLTENFSPTRSLSGCDQSATTTSCADLAKLQQSASTLTIPTELEIPVWKECVNDEVGIILEYPTKDPHGHVCRATSGDAGRAFGDSLLLPSGARIYFGATTKDFSVPKDALNVSTEGFVLKGGVYYTISRGNVSDVSFVPDELWSLADGSKVPVIYGKNFDPSADYPEPAARAMVNLSGTTFTGIGFILYAMDDTGPHAASAEDVAIFKRIVTSARPIEAVDSADDDVLIDRTGGLYRLVISTKDLKPYRNPASGIKQFAGLPAEGGPKNAHVYYARTLLSHDRSEALVVFTTDDETKESSGFDGSYPTIAASAFRCDMGTKVCSPTNILAEAYAATGAQGTWFEYPVVWWDVWDSKTNLLYGHLSGEGIGDASPLYVYDTERKTIRHTVGYGSVDDSDGRVVVPHGAISPSLKKVVMFDTYHGGGAWTLVLFDTADLSKPLKTFDISAMKNGDSNNNRVSAIAWSRDESMLVLETESQMYTLDLASGTSVLRYSDVENDWSGLWLDFNFVNLTQSGRYIVFVDYERTTSVEANKMNPVLKAIDLFDNNNTIELLREEGIRLHNAL